MSVEEEFRRKFGFWLERPFNDYSYDMIQDNGFSLNHTRETNPKKFRKIRAFASRHGNLDNEHLLLLKAHLLYIDKKYEQALKLFLAIASRNPLDINRWIDLSFGLLHAKKHYELGLDLLFNLYGYIHYCLKLNIQTINLPNLLLIQRAMKGAKEYDNKYLFPVKFDEEFLIFSRECNNNCLTCPNETRDRLALGCSIREYIEKKIGKPWVKKLIFTGGEPTILPDFFEILRDIFAVRPDIKLVIQTNGRAFSEQEFTKRMQEFKGRRIAFEVSLFSHEPEIHDRITQCRGSLDQTMQGIANLLAHGQKVEADIFICKPNREHLGKTVEYVLCNYPKISAVALTFPLSSGKCLGRLAQNECGLACKTAEKLVQKYAGKRR